MKQRSAKSHRANSGRSSQRARLSRADLELLQFSREELEADRLALEMEHRALAEAQRGLDTIRASYVDLYERAPVGIATLSVAGVVQNINMMGAELLGLPKGLSIGRPIFPFFAKQDRRKFLRYIHQAVRKRAAQIELTVAANGGEERLLEFTSVPLSGEDGGRGLSTVIRDATDGRHVQAAVREAHEQLTRVMDAAPVLITRCSRDLRYLFVNRACSNFLGLPQHEIIGRPIAEILGPQAMKAIQPHVKRVLAGKTAEFESEIFYPKVGSRYMRVYYRPEKDSTGLVVGWVAALTDITERRSMEEGLRESEERFRLLADSAPVLIWLSGVDKKCTYFNKPWLQFTGRTLKQELGNGWAKGVHPDDVQECVQSYQRAFDARKKFRIEYRLRRHDGKYRWIHDEGVPRYKRGEFMGYIGCCVDVTDRRRAAADLRATKEKLELRIRQRTAALNRSKAALNAEIEGHRQVERALRKTEHRLNDFFDQSPLALLWVGIDGRIQRLNAAAQELLERPPEFCLGQNISRFLVDSELGLDALSRLARKRSLQNFRARIRTGRGDIRHVLIDANGLWERGILNHSRWFLRDVTHRFELEREILAISEREQQRLGQDLHDDLCQRLSAIEYLSETLAVRLTGKSRMDKARARQIARMIRDSIDHTRALARGLSPVNLDEGGLTAALRELARRTQKIFHIRCRLRMHEPVQIPDPTVRLHLYRIAQEAVSNAIKHGRARRIDISLNLLKDRVMLVVRDNGIGIPVQLRKRKGMGLRVMQYRAGLIEASLIVQRQRNGGTSVECLAKVGGGSQGN